MYPEKVTEVSFNLLGCHVLLANQLEDKNIDLIYHGRLVIYFNFPLVN
jgi:hypothetical protein